MHSHSFQHIFYKIAFYRITNFAFIPALRNVRSSFQHAIREKSSVIRWSGEPRYFIRTITGKSIDDQNHSLAMPNNFYRRRTFDIPFFDRYFIEKDNNNAQNKKSRVYVSSVFDEIFCVSVATNFARFFRRFSRLESKILNGVSRFCSQHKCPRLLLIRRGGRASLSPDLFIYTYRCISQPPATPSSVLL